MTFDQFKNLRDAILKNKAKIANIDHILSWVPRTELSGAPFKESPTARLELEIKRQHLLFASAELELELFRLEQLRIEKETAKAEADRPADFHKFRKSRVRPRRRRHS